MHCLLSPTKKRQLKKRIRVYLHKYRYIYTYMYTYIMSVALDVTNWSAVCNKMYEKM